jgi:hypothetical protein
LGEDATDEIAAVCHEPEEIMKWAEKTMESGYRNAVKLGTQCIPPEMKKPGLQPFAEP